MNTANIPNQPVRIAIAGCGAVTRESLLPVLAGHPGVQVVALVDRDVQRARALGELYGITRALVDIDELTPATVDAVVVATPPAHHAPATLALLGRGLHVFVEKPMAIRTADAEAMVAAAEGAGLALGVGLYRRLLPVSRLLRGLLAAGTFGRPLKVDIEEGGEYTWQLATLSVLSREGGGGGVLIDIGSHLIDQLLYVLDGSAQLVRYADNAAGGIETDAEVDFTVQRGMDTVPCRMVLSRTRELRGSIRVECETATLELVRGNFSRLRVELRAGAAHDDFHGTPGQVEYGAEWRGEEPPSGYKAFRNEFDDWLGTVSHGRRAVLSGRSVVPVVRFIESCYASASPLSAAWDTGDRHAPGISRGRQRRVLVTGAGGFLGCRTVELLRGAGWDVRALVRRPSSAARLARFPLDIRLGDICDERVARDAVAGCSAVVHCAVGTSWPPADAYRVTVQGTSTMARTARAAGVERFVHISSMAVHGHHVPMRLDESVPLAGGTGFDYQQAKLMAERALEAEIGRGLAGLSLRPARIYGPFGKTFTVRPLHALRHGRLVLAGDAESPANMVFVDNVVHAIECALEGPEGTVGEAFLVSEPDQASWRAFYDYFARAAGRALHHAPASTPQAHHRPTWLGGLVEVGRSPEVRALAKRVMWTDPLGYWPRKWWDRSPSLQKRVLGVLGVDQAVVYREAEAEPGPEVIFDIVPTLVVFDKAADRLRYAPPVAQADAKALTLDWARWARLVD